MQKRGEFSFAVDMMPRQQSRKPRRDDDRRGGRKDKKGDKRGDRRGEKGETGGVEVDRERTRPRLPGRGGGAAAQR